MCHLWPALIKTALLEGGERKRGTPYQLSILLSALEKVKKKKKTFFKKKVYITSLDLLETHKLLPQS